MFKVVLWSPGRLGEGNELIYFSTSPPQTQREDHANNNSKTASQSVTNMYTQFVSCICYSHAYRLRCRLGVNWYFFYPPQPQTGDNANNNSKIASQPVIECIYSVCILYLLLTHMYLSHDISFYISISTSTDQLPSTAPYFMDYLLNSLELFLNLMSGK